MGHHNLTYYIDNGMTGLTLDRPAFRQMEADIEAGGITAILAKDISRIGRDGHLFSYKQGFEKKTESV